MRRNLLALLVLVALLSLGLAGCKSKEAKVCDHMMDMMEEFVSTLPEEQQTAMREEMNEEGSDCVAEVTERSARCSNGDAVMDCILEADNMEAAGACDAMCQRVGEGSN